MTRGIRCSSGSWASPDPPLGVGAGGVEVSKRRRAQPQRRGRTMEQPLERELRGAIGRRRSQARDLGYRRDAGVAVDRGRGREEERLHAHARAGEEEARPRSEVVAPVLLGIAHRLPDADGAGEVDHGLGGVALEGGGHPRRVLEGDALQRQGPGAIRRGRPEVVENHRIVPPFGEGSRHVSADVSGAARHHHLHRETSRAKVATPSCQGGSTIRGSRIVVSAE